MNIFALKKSEKAKEAEKIISDGKLRRKFWAISKIGIAINKLKNNGIKINPKGIKILKLSSNVNELTIQETPLK